MGNGESKLNFRKAVVQLTTKMQPIDAKDDAFWDQFWTEPISSIQDVFALIPAPEIRALREELPSNVATLCYKAIEQLVILGENVHLTDKEQQTVLNCCRLLTRVLPYIFEDSDWKGFFWTKLPNETFTASCDEELPLAKSLILSLSNLLFCPDFTVVTSVGNQNKPDKATDSVNTDSCEYIWEAGVGFPYSPPTTSKVDQNRNELLKLLLTCFSETMYCTPELLERNKWVQCFCSSDNRQALPIFVSLLNVVCAYKPAGSIGVPYNYLIFEDKREPLVETACQVLIVTLESKCHGSFSSSSSDEDLHKSLEDIVSTATKKNLFIDYLARIHRDEDFSFILTGICRLLNNLLQQTYLPASTKKINFHQELLVLFWKLCDINKKFLFFVLKSSAVLEIAVPILYLLNEARADQSKIGLIHIGVFILLVLSGERNFGVRLNKPFTAAAPTDVPAFTGTHSDFLILVFHRIITAGHQRLQPLYDCLLTIIVNISPYMKSTSMTTASKLLHLLEAFSTPWFLFSAPQNHHLVFFLLEIFNNVIQYQFDGNSNLIYTLIRKRQVFHRLANLPSESAAVTKIASKKKKRMSSKIQHSNCTDQEGSTIIHTSLANTPQLVSQVHNEMTASHSQGGQLEKSVSLDSCPSEIMNEQDWQATTEWVLSWKSKLPLQTIMRMLQVLVPQVEKICIDKSLTDESEILKFLQHGTLVGLLPVPHPILIRKYQANSGTTTWFRTYMWGVIYLRNIDPPIWYDTDVKLFDIQRV